MKHIVFIWALLSIFSVAQAQAPVADFTANTRAGCSPLSVRFTDVSTGNPTKWTWDFGNGTLSDQQNPVISFAPGTYTITLVVQNSDGVDGETKTDYITVYQRPTARFDVNRTQVCLGLPLSFTDQSTDPDGTITSWNWNFGDGSSSTSPNPSHLYDEPGFYTVQLSVTSSNGCSHNTSRQIRVIAGITSDFTAITDSVCTAPFQVKISNESAGPGNLTYSWNLGNGQTSTAVHPTATFTSPGTYTIRLNTTSEYGCSDPIEKTITIQGAAISVQEPAAICLNEPATFNSGSTPAALSSYWKLDNGAAEEGIQYTHRFPATGTYTLKVFKDFGFCKDSVATVVTVNPLPAVDFTASVQNGCKAPFTTQFTAQAAGAVRWNWEFGDGTTSTDQNPTHTYQTAGEFPVTLTITNADGCSNKITKADFIKIIAPVIHTNSIRANGCAPYVYRPVAHITSLLPVTSYSWNFGDGSAPVTGATPTHTYSTPGNYHVTLTITTEGGCTIVTPVNNAVRVGTLPQTGFTVANTENCLNAGFQFTNTTVESQEWAWDFGDGTTSSERNPVHHYTAPGIYTVSLTSTNNGCPQTFTIPNYVTVHPPQAAFNFRSDCGADMLHFEFTNTSEVNPAEDVTYLWKFDAAGSVTSDQENPHYTFPAFGSYEVSLTVTNGGCSHTYMQTITISNEQADFVINNSNNASNNEVCRDSRFTLRAINSTAANINTYTWTVAGNTTNGPRNFETAINQNGNYDVTLRIIDQNGCPHTITKPNFLHIVGPTAAFNTVINTPCLDSPVTFTDASSTDNTITNRIWNFGDGTLVQNGSAQVTHAYTRAGDFPITLTVEDQRGCKDASSIITPIHITAPTAAFTAENTTFCPKLPLKFNNTSRGENLSYLWTFGDGNTSDEAAPEHTYEDTDQTYSVQLTVTDQQGCTHTTNFTDYVTAITPKAALSASDDLYLCPPSEVFFTNESRDYNAVRWDFDNGNTSTKEEPVQFFNDYRNYTVRLYAIGYGGCEDVAEKIIQIANPRAVQIDYSPFPAIACNELLVDFNITLPADGLNFRFNYGNNTFAPDEQLQFDYHYQRPGRYRPTIILSDRHSCEVSVAAPSIIEIRGAIPAFAVDKTTFCDQGTANFTDYSLSPIEAITSRLWTFGTAGTSQEFNPSFNFTTPGIYPITLEVTTAGNCHTTFRDTVIVYRTPVPAIIAPDFICVNEWVDFEGRLEFPDADVKWNWAFSNQQDDQQNQSVQFGQPGTQEFTVTATNVLGCSTTTPGSIIVHALPTVQVPESIILPSGGSITLPVTYSDDATKWHWEPASTLSCPDCPRPIANPQFNTVYKLTVENEHGCKMSTDVPVNVVCSNLNFFVPNTFSPNNDGINDIFYPRGTGIDKIASMRIYNRAGVMVFERKNFPANDPLHGWKGEFKGKPSGADTYIYTIELICENATIVPYKGNITLVR